MAKLIFIVDFAKNIIMGTSSTLYLNLFETSDGSKKIKFIAKYVNVGEYYKLCRMVDWITYNDLDKAFVCNYSKAHVDLIKSYFKDYLINTTYLVLEKDRFLAKSVTITDHKKAYQLVVFKRIVLLAGELDGGKVILLKFKPNSEVHNKLLKHEGFIYDKGQYYVKYSFKALKAIIEYLIPFAEVGISSMTRITDSNIKYLLLAQNFLRHGKTCCSQSFVEFMWLKNYSESTVSTYFYCISVFLQFKTDVADPQMIVSRFLNEIKSSGKASRTVNQYVNAIRLWHTKTLNIAIDYTQLRPKKEKSLPKVLSYTEIESIVKNTENLKHKCVILTAYSAGLRISELVNLKLIDIDSTNMFIRVNRGKGNKDRLTILSQTLLTNLRDYFREYKPKIWLFEGMYGDQYSRASIGQMFKRSLKKSGVPSRLTFHCLRHSFATHLLNNGSNLRQVQHLLGHGDVKTTEIYTYVSNENISSVVSPADRLNFK